MLLIVGPDAAHADHLGQVRQEVRCRGGEPGALRFRRILPAELPVGGGGDEVVNRVGRQPGLVDVGTGCLVVADHVVAERDHALKIAERARVAVEHVEHQVAAAVPLARQRQAQAVLSLKLGVVGVERQPALADLQRGRNIALEEERGHVGLQGPRIVRIEIDGAPGRLEGKLQWRLGAPIDGIAEADLVEIGERQQRPGGSIGREAIRRALQASLDRAMRAWIEIGAIGIIGERAGIGLPVVGRLPHQLGRVGVEDDAIGLGDRGGHLAGDRGLGLEELRDVAIAVIVLGPDDRSVVVVDKARRQPKPPILEPDGPLKLILGRRVRLPRDRPRAGDQIDLLEEGKLPDDLLGEAPGERRGLGRVRHRLERADHEPRDPERGGSAGLRRRRSAEEDHIGHQADRRDQGEQQGRPGAPEQLAPPAVRRAPRSDKPGAASRTLDVALPPGEGRHIAALGNGDNDRIVRAGSQVIVFERLPHPARLDAHHRIGRAVEGGIASQHVGGDGKGLDAVGTAANRLFNDIGKKASRPVRDDEIGAVEHTHKRAAHRLGCRCTKKRAAVGLATERFHRGYGHQSLLGGHLHVCYRILRALPGTEKAKCGSLSSAISGK